MDDPETIHRFAEGDRIVVIANPATRVRARTIARILTGAVPPGVSMELRWTDAPGAGVALAREAVRYADAVVAVGGDGTVADVASALIGTDVPLGILPGGSTNIVAREHGIPTDLEAAARLLFGRHHRRAIDAGVCNDRPFLHMAGSGFDSVLFEIANVDLKRRVGWMAYLPAAMQALRVPPVSYTVVTGEGEQFTQTSPLVLVANGASIIHPDLRLSDTIRADDGWLDLMIVTATTPPQLASVIGRLMTLRFESSPLVIHRRVREVWVDASRLMPVQLDGDVVERTPAHFSIRQKAIHLIVPA
ncbi:MAG TPA: diacylglycerol kinase family protein [Thermomicrobiales bacterium]|nr:diacylglycerol kinase family protein [Thermomicrobiales bacterium]